MFIIESNYVNFVILYKYKFYILLYVKITLIIINSREKLHFVKKKKKRRDFELESMLVPAIYAPSGN